MKYLVVQLISKGINIHERKAYINSLYDKRDFVVKPGFIKKFSKAIGFTEESKYTPEDLLVENLYTYVEGEVFTEFYIPKRGFIGGDNSRDVKAITYEELANKWAKFLMKVFPQLKVDLIETDELPDRKAFIVSTAFKTIEEYPITTDLSIDSALTNEEVFALRNLFLKLNYKLMYRVFEYECNVCSERDSNNPIHIEIETSKSTEWSSEGAIILINNC